jgi:restriction system protein
MLAGYKNGIFVTTSDFQPGALTAADKYRSKTLPITLINSAEFYEELKISRMEHFDYKKYLNL